MELTGNFNGSTATLSNAYISEDLLIDGNLYGNTATLSYAYISEDLLIGKNLTTDTATISTAYISGDLSIDGNLTGTTATLSSAYISEDLWVDQNLTSETATIANAYISGTLTSNSGRFTRLFSIDFSASNGYITNFGANNFSAANGGIQGSFSAADGRFTDLATNRFSATSGYVTNFGVTNSFSAADGRFTDLNTNRFSATSGYVTNFGVTNSFSAADGRFTDLNTDRFSATSGYVTNFGVTNNFSAAMASFNEIGVFGAFSAAQGLFTTRLDAALFSAGNSTLANTIIVGNLDITGVLAASFSTLADTTINGNLSVLGGNSLFITGNAWIGGDFSASTAKLTGNLSAGSAYINGYFSAGASSLGSTTITGVLSSDNGTFTDLYSTRFSAASVNLTDLFATRFSASAGFLTNMGVTTNFSAANIGLSGTFSVPNGRFSSNLGVGGLFSAANGGFTNLSAAAGFLTNMGVTTNFSAANIGVTSAFSAATGVFSGNLSAGTAFVNGAFSAGNSSLANTYIAGNVEQLESSRTDLGKYLALWGQQDESYLQTIEFVNLNNNGIFLTQNSVGDLLIDNDNTGGKIQSFVNDNTFHEFYVNNLKIAAISKNALETTFLSNPSPTTSSAPRLRIGAAIASIATGPNLSDIRLKDNIQDTSDAIETIKQLRPRTFNYKDINNLANTSPSRQIGLIAQEVEAIFPYLVSDSIEVSGVMYKGLDYGRLTAVLVGGMQEQQDQIEVLSLAIGTLNLSSLQDLYNQFNSALENLSMSSEDGKLVVNSGLTVTGQALFNSANFTGDVKVGQVKVDSLENDISIDTASCVDMDGNPTSNCDTNKLNIMKNKAGNVEMFDGKVKFRPNGEVMGEKVQAKTFKNNTSTAPSGSDSCTTGEFKFAEESGQSYIFYCNSSSNWVRSQLSSY